jgi:hypothetical protein
MSIAQLTFVPSMRKLRPPVTLDYELLESATTLYEQGETLASIHKTLAHLFPGREIGDLRATPFSFVQGSSRVTVSVEGEWLSAKVPLALLPTGGTAIAALRFSLAQISASGQLYQPRLSGEELYLEYRDRLTRSHPAKLIEVLRRMPSEADDRDDWLIGQFAARPAARAEVQKLSPEELGIAHDFWVAHWTEIEELSKESQRKRSVFFLNDLTAYSIFRPRYVLPISGYLSVRMREAASVYNDGQEEPGKREASVSKFAREMRSVTREQLDESLGHAEYALSPVVEGKPATLAGYFGEVDYMNKVEGLRNSGKSFDAAFSLTTALYYLLARHVWSLPAEQAMVSLLAESAGKSWREATTMLFDRCREIAEKYGASEAEEADDEGEDEGAGEAADEEASDASEDAASDGAPSSAMGGGEQ